MSLLVQYFWAISLCFVGKEMICVFFLERKWVDGRRRRRMCKTEREREREREINLCSFLLTSVT